MAQQHRKITKFKGNDTMTKDKPNPNSMLKAEMLDRFNFRCVHRHNGWDHPKCYYDARKQSAEVIGCFDIESSNLKANFGIMLSWAMYYPNTGETVYDHVTPEDIKAGRTDARVVSSCIDELKGLDRVVTHYGDRFDIPFVRTRALYWQHEIPQEAGDFEFPEHGSLYSTDVWKIARHKLCIHSNRQGCVGEALSGHDEKTRIHPGIWLDMSYGNEAQRKTAIAYIIKHNVIDVHQLAGNFEALRPYTRLMRYSI